MGEPKSDRCGSFTSAGWKRQHGGKDMPSNWRSPPRPSAKSPEQVDRITGSTGKSIEGERVTDGFVVALRRGNARGAKEPCCLYSLRPQGRQGRDDKGVHRFAGPEAENIRQGEGRDVLEVLGIVPGTDRASAGRGGVGLPLKLIPRRFQAQWIKPCRGSCPGRPFSC